MDPLISWDVLGHTPSLLTALQGSHLPGVKSTSPTKAPKALNDLPLPPPCFYLFPFFPAFPGEAAVPRAPGDSPACDVPVDPAESSATTKEKPGSHWAVGGQWKWARIWNLNAVHASPQLCDPGQVLYLSGPYSHQIGWHFIPSK